MDSVAPGREFGAYEAVRHLATGQRRIAPLQTETVTAPMLPVGYEHQVRAVQDGRTVKELALFVSVCVALADDCG